MIGRIGSVVEKIQEKWNGMSKGARVALLLSTLAALVLLILTARYWMPALLIGTIAAAALLIWWKGQQYANIERYKSEAASFLYWFLAKNYRINEQIYRQEDTSIPLKHIHDAMEIKRLTTVYLRKNVAQVEVQLTLGRNPTDRDHGNLANFLEWLRTDAYSYDAESNRTGWSGFSYLDPTSVTISGQHLHIRFVLANSPLAVYHLRNQLQVQKTEVDFRDDDYTNPPFFDVETATRGKVVRYGWDVSEYPHGLVTGSTGTGKTVALLLLLTHAVATMPGLKIVVCDYKRGKDFAFLDGCEHFYPYEQCIEGIAKVSLGKRGRGSR